MNHRGPTRGKLQERGLKQSKKDTEMKKPTLKPVQVYRRGVVKRKLAPRKAPEPQEFGKSSGSKNEKRVGMKTIRTSSTPLTTPSKTQKFNSAKKDSEFDSLSNISKSSSRSSVCSSVSSGLIELLYNYNSTNAKDAKNQDEPERDLGQIDQDETLKNEPTLSIVIPTEQPNCDGRIKILSELLNKLKTTVNSIISSGDTKSLKRLGKIIEILENEFQSLQNDLPALWVQKRDFESEIENKTAPLKCENAALQRKIRILNQNLAEKERNNSEKDINLELETVQCMNNTMMEQVKKLSSLLQQLQAEKGRQENVILNLKKENQKLNEDLLYKNAEFTKSQEIFSTEAGTIKTEVASALQKVNALKRQLCEAETESELMKVSLQEKGEEIARLNDLNRGLQSSVSRLLDDLKKASIRPQNRLAPSNEMSSAFLQNLQNVLNTPQLAPQNPQIEESFFQKPLRPSLIKSYPPLSGKENFTPHPCNGYISPPRRGGTGDFNSEDDFYQNTFEDVLESSRMSSVLTDPPIISAGSLSTGAHYFKIPKRSSATTITKPTLWEQSSVSSLISFTSRDENDFANGLALLDADIQRLQDSLHDMSTKTLEN